MTMDEKTWLRDQKKQTQQTDCIMERAPMYGTKKERYTLKDYYALPADRRCELIDGRFCDMAAPGIAHQIAARDICMKLTDYIKKKNGKCLSLAAPVDVQLDCDDDTMVQPDVLVVCDRSKVKNRCVYGAPEFVAEILSESTRWKDSVLKLRKYREAGVREYWIIDLESERTVVYEFAADGSEIPDGQTDDVEKCAAAWGRYQETRPGVYGMDQKIPVGIFEGECRIDMAEIYGEIRFFLNAE